MDPVQDNSFRFHDLQQLLTQDNFDIIDYLLSNQFSSLSYDNKVFVKNLNRPCRPLPSLTVTEKRGHRSFQTQWYNKLSWLAGSVIRNKLFCWSCLLFAETHKGPWNGGGYGNLKELYRAATKHQCSKDHIHAALKFKLFGKLNIANSLDSAHRQSIENHNRKVKENREIIERLIDMTLYLATQELPFRGHDETSSSLNQGHYKELAKLLSKYDEKFKNFLDDSSVFSGLSKSIQNDLISSINFVIQEHINLEIKNATCFSWQVDETTDISCFSQLSVIFRYTFEGKIIERFMGFFNVSEGRRADDLCTLLKENFEKYDIKNKLVGQTYDGASVMSGELNGLQTKIKQIAPQALFIHCYAHRLNLVLQDATNKIKECRIFFASLGGLATFFSKSTKRTNVLDEVLKRRLPKNAETRWNFKSRLISTVVSNRENLLEVFETITNSAEFAGDRDTIREAQGFTNNLTDFNCVFLLRVFNLIFQQTDILFSIIQNRNSDITYCSNRVETLLSTLKKYRNDDDYIKNIFDEVVSELGPPKKKRKADFDGLGDDVILSTSF